MSLIFCCDFNFEEASSMWNFHLHLSRRIPSTFIFICRWVNANDCVLYPAKRILKCNILQYSLTREKKRSGGIRWWGDRRWSVGVWDEKTFTMAQYWYSVSILLSFLVLSFSRFAHFAPGISFTLSICLFPSNGGSYLTTVICISILLKKISNKVSRRYAILPLSTFASLNIEHETCPLDSNGSLIFWWIYRKRIFKLLLTSFPNFDV